MIVGESEILGQVRDAWQTAVREGTAPQLVADCSGTRSSRASGCAPRPGSAAIRCRSRRPRSPVAAEHLGDLDGAQVLVIGAGQMGSGLASTLRSRGVDRRL